MAPRSSPLDSLFDDASWTEALSDARVLRRRFVLAEVLGQPMALRRDPRDLSRRRESGREEPER